MYCTIDHQKAVSIKGIKCTVVKFLLIDKFYLIIVFSYLFCRNPSKRYAYTCRLMVIHFSAVMVPGLLMIAQVFLGCDRVGSIVIFTTALTVNGAVTAGYLGNGLDIAPNFSGKICCKVYF